MSHDGYNTVLPACSLEFCPAKGQERFFAVGTYKLEEGNDPRTGSQCRTGECLIFEVDHSMDDTPTFRQVTKTQMPAILDMRWCHRSPDHPALLGIADSEGSISVHQFNGTQTSLTAVQTVRCTRPDTLCLSLDWANRRHPTSDLAPLAVSLSDKDIVILRPNEQGELQVTDHWHAHEFEPWIVAWNAWDDNLLYSGGDDLMFKGWDVRQGFDQPIFVNKRFEGGVTTIHSHPHQEHIIAVGSYDASVRIFDARKPLVPLNTTDVGGGLWRLKWHPDASRSNDLLAACMHNGFRVLRYETSTFNKTEVVTHFDKHESLAYGADWSFGPADNRGRSVVGSCSFYDHLLHVWKA